MSPVMNSRANLPKIRYDPADPAPWMRSWPRSQEEHRWLTIAREQFQPVPREMLSYLRGVKASAKTDPTEVVVEQRLTSWGLPGATHHDVRVTAEEIDDLTQEAPLPPEAEGKIPRIAGGVREGDFVDVPVNCIEVYMEMVVDYVNNNPRLDLVGHTRPRTERRTQCINLGQTFGNFFDEEECPDGPTIQNVHDAFDAYGLPRRTDGYVGFDFSDVDYVFIPFWHHGYGHWTLVGFTPIQGFVFHIDPLLAEVQTKHERIIPILKRVILAAMGHVPQEWQAVRSRYRPESEDDIDNDQARLHRLWAYQTTWTECGLIMAENMLCLAFGYDLHCYQESDLLMKRIRMSLELLNGGFDGTRLDGQIFRYIVKPVPKSLTNVREWQHRQRTEMWRAGHEDIFNALHGISNGRLMGSMTATQTATATTSRSRRGLFNNVLRMMPGVALHDLPSRRAARAAKNDAAFNAPDDPRVGELIRVDLSMDEMYPDGPQVDDKFPEQFPPQLYVSEPFLHESKPPIFTEFVSKQEMIEFCKDNVVADWELYAGCEDIMFRAWLENSYGVEPEGARIALDWHANWLRYQHTGELDLGSGGLTVNKQRLKRSTKNMGQPTTSRKPTARGASLAASRKPSGVVKGRKK